jgi:hypothetical protein
MMIMVVVVVWWWKLDDVGIGVDGLLDVIDDIGKLAMLVERRREAKGIDGRPMAQHGLSLNHSREGVAIVLQKANLVDRPERAGRLSLVDEEGTNMVSQDLLLLVDGHGGLVVLGAWWYAGECGDA